MAGFKFNIEVTGLPTGGFFNKFKLFFNKELKLAEKDIKARLLFAAREDHRYQHQTLNLRNATKVKGGLTSKNGITLYVDLYQADYAKYVIKGHGSWAEDPFLDEALAKNEDWINARIKKAIDKATVKFNRLK